MINKRPTNIADKECDGISTQQVIREAILVSLIIYALGTLKHLLIQTHVFDLGLYEQWISLAGQGRWSEVGSLYEGFTRTNRLFFGDHSSVILLPIGFLYRIWPSTGLLLGIQAAGMGAGYGFLLKYANENHIEWKRIGLLRATILLNPIFFNSALDLFNLESIAFPLVVASLLATRQGKLRCSFLLAVVAILTKELAAAWCFGLALYILIKENRLYGVLLSVTSISLGISLYLLNTGNHDKLTERLLTPQRVESFELMRSSSNGAQLVITQLGEILGTSHVIYLSLISAFLLLFASKRMLPAIFGMLPIAGINLVSEADTMRSMIYHYQLPVLMWAVIGIIDCGVYTWFERIGAKFQIASLLTLTIIGSGFISLSQYKDPFTSWWSQSAYIRDARQINMVIKGINPENNRTIHIAGDLATRLAGFDKVYWETNGKQMPPEDVSIVVLKKGKTYDGSDEPLWRKLANFIFRYGHPSEHRNEFDDFFSTVNKEMYDCSHTKDDSRIAICTRN